MRYVGASGHTQRPGPNQPTRSNVLSRKDFVARAFDLRVRCVCATCNGGWMSNLETAARPILEPLIHGQTCQLDGPAQQVLAKWAFKTMAMIQFTHPTSPSFPARQLQHLYDTGTVHVGIHIWCAKCEGTPSPIEPLLNFFFFDSSGTIRGPDPTPEVPVGYRYSATVRVDHVAFQLVGLDDLSGTVMDRGFDHGYWSESIVQLWPAVGPIAWPPRIHLGQSQWLPFATRFASLPHRSSSEERP